MLKRRSRELLARCGASLVIAGLEGDELQHHITGEDAPPGGWASAGLVSGPNCQPEPRNHEQSTRVLQMSGLLVQSRAR